MSNFLVEIEVVSGTVAATVSPAVVVEGGGGATDHGALTGLSDDDHTQYHTDARAATWGDARYEPLDSAYTKAEADTRYVNETDHTKAAHDALDIDADTLDGVDSTGFATSSHNHDATYVNEADHTKAAHDALNIDADTLDGIDSTGFAAASHNHAAADVTSGVFAIGRLATGTPDGTKFVRDDGTLVTPSGITGIAVEEDGVEEGTGLTRLNFTTGLDVSVSGQEATVSAGSSSGFTPDYVAQTTNALFAARGDGDPKDASLLPMVANQLANAGVTGTALGTTRVLMVKFRLPKALSVAHLYAHTGEGAATTGIFCLGIYEATGARVWTSGFFNTVAGPDWQDITTNLPVSLSANTNYWFAISASATSNVTPWRTMPILYNANYWGTASAKPLSGRSIGLEEYAQFATTSGTMPTTLGTLVNAATGIGVPVFFLEGTAS